MHMNHYFSLGFIYLFILVSLTVFCVADEVTDNEVYVQGGESSITHGSDGIFVITVKNIVPYFRYSEGENSSMIPVNQLTDISYPVSGALVLSGKGNETTVMVQITNVSLPDGNKILVLRVNPLEYYDGELLHDFNSRSKSLSDDISVDTKGTSLYMETRIEPKKIDYKEILNLCTENCMNECLAGHELTIGEDYICLMTCSERCEQCMNSSVDNMSCTDSVHVCLGSDCLE